MNLLLAYIFKARQGGYRIVQGQVDIPDGEAVRSQPKPRDWECWLEKQLISVDKMSSLVLFASHMPLKPFQRFDWNLFEQPYDY